MLHKNNYDQLTLSQFFLSFQKARALWWQFYSRSRSRHHFRHLLHLIVVRVRGDAQRPLSADAPETFSRVEMEKKANGRSRLIHKVGRTYKKNNNNKFIIARCMVKINIYEPLFSGMRRRRCFHRVWSMLKEAQVPRHLPRSISLTPSLDPDLLVGIISQYLLFALHSVFRLELNCKINVRPHQRLTVCNVVWVPM